MKTFLNVLYRRILYKIPLKLLLVLLAIFGLLFAYSKAELIELNSQNVIGRNGGTYYDTYSADLTCLYTSSRCEFNYNFNGSAHIGNVNMDIDIGTPTLLCTTGHEIHYDLLLSTCDVTFYSYKTTYTSLQCQSEYSLIPISEVDSSYCQSNNLCPSGGTPSDCPNVGVSNLFINDIFHPGAFNIIMNIPEEIDWDYAYTNSGQNINIDVVGYNVDYEAVQSVIDTQSYKPTDEDFSNLIAVLGPYSKIIIFFVFLFIVWAWIKKPFKSKKL